MHRTIQGLTVSATVVLAGSLQAQISFQAPSSVALQGARPDWVATGDFDSDGDSDIAVSTGQLQGQGGPERVEIFLNNGSGSFTSAQAVVLPNNAGAAAIVAGDFDTDGDLDLAVSLKNFNTVQIVRNSAGVFSLFGSAVSVAGVEPRHMAGADLDADGDIDLVTSNRVSNNLSVLLNNGSAVFNFSGTLGVGLEPRHVALEDLNGDCDTDIAVAAHDSRRVDVLFNFGNGAFGPIQTISVPGNEKPSGMVAADLDVDGDVDLVSTTDNNNAGLVVVMTNTGNGTFSAVTFPTNGQAPDAIIAADLDGDGDKDLATADEDASLVSVLRNLGGTSFGGATTFAVGTHPTSIASTDLDGNGSIDLVVANRDSNNVSLLRNVSSGGTERYCVGLANSVGAGARIDTLGSVGIAANSFALTVRCAPPNQNGIFFYGASINNVPFHAGRLCVRQPVTRLGPIVTTSATGHLVRQVNFNTPPANSGASQIQPGSTWYFQFWYRDPTAGLTNTTDGLRATFRP